ncbi:osmotin-like protein [Tasmannia lanceolata]|uniref:osmotin-like protein n=1 Tax=Tasmannia lanceolata TaxID=3420 RepID=UPI0040641153
MAFALLSFLFFSALHTNAVTDAVTTVLTVVNNCPFTIYPGVQPNGGYPIPINGGFRLQTLEFTSFSIPTRPWSGRVWARTGCSYHRSHLNRLTCETGDCSTGLTCNGAGGVPPISLAEFFVPENPNSAVSYSVSLVDGFNLPLTVTPHWGSGECPVVGCRTDLLEGCPEEMVVRGRGGHVVGCKSACGAFGSDEYCCRGEFGGVGTCRPSKYSQAFKRCCPDTYTYPKDSPSVTQSCISPTELKVIFCH